MPVRGRGGWRSLTPKERVRVCPPPPPCRRKKTNGDWSSSAYIQPFTLDMIGTVAHSKIIGNPSGGTHASPSDYSSSASAPAKKAATSPAASSAAKKAAEAKAVSHGVAEMNRWSSADSGRGFNWFAGCGEKEERGEGQGQGLVGGQGQGRGVQEGQGRKGEGSKVKEGGEWMQLLHGVSFFCLTSPVSVQKAAVASKSKSAAKATASSKAKKAKLVAAKKAKAALARKSKAKAAAKKLTTKVKAKVEQVGG